MGTYLLLYSIDVEHTYFFDSICRGLDFVPSKKTAVLLEKIGLLTRSTANGINVFYDEERAEALNLYADDKEEPLSFRYKVFSKDPLFINYTSPCIRREDAILCFESDGAKESKDGRRKLHEEKYVSDLDFEKLDSLNLTDLIGKREKLIRPAFTVNIGFEGKENILFDKDSNARLKTFYIKFEAKKTYWKYYLLGGMKERTPYIADVENKNEFEYTGDERLPGNRCASIFRSKTAISLQERPACSFQLREGSKGGGKVLIKRLPVASADRFGREIVDGEEIIVSEIYINN